MRDWEGNRRQDLGRFDDSLVHSRDKYIVVSDERVMVVCDDPVYVTLERWEQLCRILPKVIRIPFFAHYKKRRLFYIWRSKVRSKKFNLARNSLKEQLFILNQACRDFYFLEVWKPLRQNATNTFKETNHICCVLYRLYTFFSPSEQRWQTSGNCVLRSVTQVCVTLSENTRAPCGTSRTPRSNNSNGYWSLFTTSNIWNNDQIKLTTKTFASFCTFKCVMCVYPSLSFSVINRPETVSRAGERADDVRLPQLFVASTRTHPCVHAQNSWYT